MNNDSQAGSDLANYFIKHLFTLNSNIKPAVAKELWQDIATRYREPVRAYHTLRHLEQLLSQFEQIKHDLNQPSVIALALYYHDVIYEPKRSDNELKSAVYMLDKLNCYLSHEQCQRIYDLIMMTSDHQLYDTKDKDAAYLLDMDLSILGAFWSEYQQYAKAVRQEYAHVSKTDYQAGRTKVLTGLLAHPRLYLTDCYYRLLETQARENIKREISLLRAA